MSKKLSVLFIAKNAPFYRILSMMYFNYSKSNTDTTSNKNYFNEKFHYRQREI